MSVFNDVFICGDSHAASFSLTPQGSDLNFSTLGGYGLFSLMDSDTLRPVPNSFRAGVDRYFRSLPKKSKIFISYTDTESRTGIGERKLDDDFLKYYQEIVDSSILYIHDLCEFDRLFFLDIFSCIEEKADEQTCSPIKRIKNREFVNNRILNSGVGHSVSLITTFCNPLFETNGVVKTRSLLSDNVHYNLGFVLENGQNISEWIRSEIDRNV